MINNLLNIINIEHHIINGNTGQTLFFSPTFFPLFFIFHKFLIAQIADQITQLFFPNLGNFQTMLMQSFHSFQINNFIPHFQSCFQIFFLQFCKLVFIFFLICYWFIL